MHIFLRLLIYAYLRLLYAVSSSFLRTVVLFLTVGFADTFPAQQRKIPVLWNFQQCDFAREWLTFAKYHCFHAEFFYPPAKRNSSIMEFAVARFLNKARQNRILPSVTYKTCRASFPARAERVEFSRLSIIRLKAYSARKEGRTDPQAGIVAAIAESSLCFIVWYCKAVNGWSATRSCEWVGSPLKRHRKMLQERLACFITSFILRHFQSAVKRSVHLTGV